MLVYQLADRYARNTRNARQSCSQPQGLSDTGDVVHHPMHSILKIVKKIGKSQETLAVRHSFAAPFAYRFLYLFSKVFDLVSKPVHFLFNLGHPDVKPF